MDAISLRMGFQMLFPSYPERPDRFRGHEEPPTEPVRRGEGGCCLRLKRLKRDSDHSHHLVPITKNFVYYTYSQTQLLFYLLVQ